MKTQAKLKDGRTITVSLSNFDVQNLEIEEIEERGFGFYVLQMSMTDIIASSLIGSSDMKFSFIVTYDENRQEIDVLNFRQINYSLLRYSLDSKDELELLVMSYLSVEIN